MLIDHGLLHGVESSTDPSQILYRKECLPLNGMGKPDTAIDGPKSELSLLKICKHYGAGATVTLAAAFFCSSAVKILSDNFQQHSICGHVIQLDTLAVFNESKSLA